MTYGQPGAKVAEFPVLARVEREVDPKNPGRTAIVIMGRTAECVQSAIDTISASAEGALGIANFVGPIRSAGGWGAMGVVTLDPEEYTT